MIIIIGVVALIVSPIILNVVSKSKKAAFERSIDGIIEAVRIDLSDDDFLTPREYFYEGSELSLLTVNDKKRDEIVKISGRIDGNGFIYVDGEGNIIINNICNKEYCANGKEEEIEISKNPTGEVPDIHKEDPVITLNGDSMIYVELNGSYKELGAVARTKGGDPLEYTTEIKKNNEVVEGIDTSVEGTYIIKYSTNNNEKTVSVTREVAVLNMIPVITMTESNETYEKEKEVLINVSGIKPNKVTGFTYEIKKDVVSLSKESVLELTKTLTFNETGNYEVIVGVTDNNSHSNTLSKTYKIDRTKPSITVPENTVLKITEVTTYNVLEGITVNDNIDKNPVVETSGSLTATLGEQTITYTVRDQAGNEETVVRKFTVVEAEGPILNFSNAGSSVWTKAQTITVTATDNSNLKTFTYEVIKDGVSKGVKNVNVSGKSAEASVALNESGVYVIKLTGSDEYGNSTALSSGEYKIDVTDPVVGSVTPSGTMGSNSWYTSNVTFSITNGTDGLSGHKSTTVAPTSLTSNTTGTSVTVTTEDNAGNKVTKTYGPYRIDKTAPTFTVKSTASVTVTKGASNAIQSTYFNSPTWSISGTGSVTCKVGSTTVTNTSSLAVGTHTVTCTATGVNGLTASANKSIIIKAPVADTSGANKPTLSNGLIPIKWNGSNWVKADTNNLSDENQWYDYNSQMWANAASVTSSYRNVSVGDSIPESAINAYFVWIPRYEYQYTNLGTSYAGGSQATPGQININFIATSKTSPSTNYKIHPAFTFGSTQLAGIWVGKFETSAASGSACFTTPSIGNCNNAGHTPYIKPNVNSLRYMQVINMYQTAQKFSAPENSYGISTSADAHVMKNSEWGAVAYLSQSKYGKYGNSNYSGANKEIYINNNINFTTGCSAGAPSPLSSTSCAYTYEKSPGGTGASTSGTIYGVYDMSGGANEYVMGIYDQTTRYSGFSGVPASKYYDNYTSTSATSACNGNICYGHALSETSEWYSDRAEFIYLHYPWFVRGGDISNTTIAGVFYKNRKDYKQKNIRMKIK